MARAGGIRTRRELLRCTGGAAMGYLGKQYVLAREKLAMAEKVRPGQEARLMAMLSTPKCRWALS